jgi:polyhydroxybutyrate depolymerase
MRTSLVTSFVVVLFFCLLGACGSKTQGTAGDGGDAATQKSDGAAGEASDTDDGGGPNDEAGGGGNDATAATDSSMPQELWNVTLETVNVKGTNRTYTLSVPKNYDAGRSYPVVLVFHGDGGDGAGLRGYYFFESASGTDAIVAYPDGTGGTWDLYDPDPNNPDFDFVGSLIDQVAGKYNIDKSKVLGTGWSNGAFFVNEVACNRPGLFAVIAPNSGGAPGTNDANWPLKYPNGFMKCVNNEAPTPAYIVHGKNDATVTPDSGEFDDSYWSYVNGCASTSTATTPTPCISSDACPAGEAVVYCEIPGMGHAVWSGTAAGAWAFFKAQKP